MKESVNGFPVVAVALVPDSEMFKKNRRVILVDRGEDSRPRYVTAIHVAGESSWDQGHYIHELAKAITDFVDRWKTRVL